MELQAAVEVERVTHAKGPDEDADLARVALVVEEEAAVAVQVVEAAVRHVAEVLEQALESAILSFLDHDVDVAVTALEGWWKGNMAVHAHGGAAEQPHQHVRLCRSLQ